MPGSGPGGRWFKSIRPDHSFVLTLRNPALTSAPFLCGFWWQVFSFWPGKRAQAAGFRAVPHLLAVGHPDVFHMDGVVEKPAAFALFHVATVGGAAFVCENLLQIAYR